MHHSSPHKRDWQNKNNEPHAFIFDTCKDSKKTRTFSFGLLHAMDESKNKHQVFVKLPQGKTVVFSVNVSATTLLSLKQGLEKKCGIPINSQKLYLLTKLLDDNTKTLSDYGVCDNSTLLLNISLGSSS